MSRFLPGRLFALLLAGSLAIGLAACDFSGIQELGDKLTISVEVPPPPSTFSLRLVDAATRQPLNVPVNIRVTGPDKDKIVDGVLFEPIQPGVVQTPFLTVAIPDGVVPSESNPLRFTIVFEANGYVSTSSSFHVVEQVDLDRAVEFVNISNPPEGTTSTVDNTGSTSGNGQVTRTYTVVASDPTVGTASVSVPVGTTITDAEGNPLQGNLQTEMVYFNPLKDEALAAFPGGLNELRVQQAAGEQPGSFVSAGFVSVEIKDAAGRQGTDFSEPLSISLSVPQDMVNPTTGQTLKAGDKVPLWSYEPSTGAWKEEGTVTLTDAAAKLGTPGLAASFETRHLTYWNLDWFASWPEQTCGRGFTLNVAGNQNNRALRIQFVHPKYGWQYNETLWGDNDQVTFQNFPLSLEGVAFTARFFDAQDGTLISGAEVPLSCGGSATTTVDTSGLPFAGPTELRASIDCGDRKAVISYPFYYRRNLPNTYFQYGRMQSGVARITAEEGADYLFQVSYRDESGFQTVESTFRMDGVVEDGVLVVERSFNRNDEGVQEICSKF